jgi:hypothetical protein
MFRLTVFFLSPSLRYFAPSTPIWLPCRLSEINVCFQNKIKYRKRYPDYRVCFEDFTNELCTFIAYDVVFQMKGTDCLDDHKELLYLSVMKIFLKVTVLYCNAYIRYFICCTPRRWFFRFTFVTICFKKTKIDSNFLSRRLHIPIYQCLYDSISGIYNICCGMPCQIRPSAVKSNGK